ncbi:LysR family transcriptional regulator [Oxalobacteraceae bacterium OM1]|nr:LysR family transcriptional regulator [Oxalobacteraceae bacterium OM1]
MLGDDLDYFLALAASRTFTSTAEKLGISQPALTKAIQRLERKVGVNLVMRTARGTELTEAGRAFYARVQTASRGLDEAIQEARDLGGGKAGLLRIGITPATTDFTLRALLPRLIEERPAAHISFTTAFAGSLMETVNRRDVEFAVCPVPERSNAALEYELLYEDPCRLMVNELHPLAGRDCVPLEELAEYEWAGTRKHEYTRAQIERAFTLRKLPLPRMVVEADTLAALILVVSQTRLVSMINLRSIQASALPDNVVVRPLSVEGMDRPIGIIRRAGYLSPIAVRAQELLREAAGQLT